MNIEECAREMVEALESRYPVTSGLVRIQCNAEGAFATVDLEGTLSADQFTVAVRPPTGKRVSWVVEVGYREVTSTGVVLRSFPRHVIARDLPAAFQYSLRDALRSLGSG